MSALADRLRRMDADEFRFRARGELRKLSDRLRYRMSRPQWRRERLRRILASPTPAAPIEWSRVRSAAADGDWTGTHRALVAYFASRRSAFPLDNRDLMAAASLVNSRFPDAAGDARARADRILRGRYDLLGYTDLELGHPPDWHLDPAHRRRASGGFWAGVEYLDPRNGDHKIIWELNRHQHWLALGRAFALTGDIRYYRAFVEQLEHWMAHNPPLAGINWASMLELAFRSLSWLWAVAFFSGAEAASQDVPWLVDLLGGIDRQLEHVEHNLSRYFSPNTHLTGEALALYVAGTCLPELPASAHRAKVGRDVLLREIERQILADGGHAELSAHYHRYSTDFYLLAYAVARKSGDAAAPAFEDAAHRQAAYLRTIADDRGRLPQLGDDDGGQLFPMAGRQADDCTATLAIAATLLDDPALRLRGTPEEAFWFCGASAHLRPQAPISWPSRALAASGYYVSRTDSGHRLIFDAGPHGFLNGGHAHSDALSVVLTLAGRPLLIDPGTATYTMSPQTRDLFRSTAMHNTVVVNGQPQSRPRGPFHWESAATAHATVWRTGDGCDYAEGTHDGYAPLAHTRGVLALYDIGWLIVDYIGGTGRCEADLYWHLAPGWLAARGKERTVELVARDGVRAAIGGTGPIDSVAEAPGAVGLDACSPAYGRIELSTTLHANVAGELPLSFGTFIAGSDAFVRSLSVDRADVDVAPDRVWHASAFEVTAHDARLTVLSCVNATGAAPAGVAPARLWGTRGLQTDARAAVLISQGAQRREAILIEGTTLRDADGRAIVQLRERVPVLRVAVGRELASSVQVGRDRSG